MEKNPCFKSWESPQRRKFFLVHPHVMIRWSSYRPN
jgi:hypothetical protein